MSPSRTRSPERGQASLEYAGVLAVVAAVLVVVVGTLGGSAILNGVLRGFERALCVVTGGSCEPVALEACTLRSHETGATLGVRLTVVELGGAVSVLREELSDGTIDVTLVDDERGAPTAGLGLEAGVQTGGKRRAKGSVAVTQLVGHVGRRRTWHVPDAATADRLVHRIREHVAAEIGAHAVPIVGSGIHRIAHAVGYHGDELPNPDVTSVEAGLQGSVSADLPGIASVQAVLQASVGGSRDRRSGRRTLILGLGADGSAQLSRALGGDGLEGSRAPTVSVTFDRAGVPIELGVATSGATAGGLDVPVPGRVGREGERVDVSRRLDLTRPANRAAYDRLVHALSPPRAAMLPQALDALAAQVRAGARYDVARYASGQTSYGADAEAAVGGRLGGSVTVSRSTAQLTGAWTRPAGGVWEARTDCLPDVAGV